MFPSQSGGHFTSFANDGEKLVIYCREKDTRNMMDGEDDAIAVVASDNWGEFPDDVQDKFPFAELSYIPVNFVLAVPNDLPAARLNDEGYRVATSYPNLARSAMQSLGIDGEVSLELGGGVEAAPRARPRRVNAIVDICASGRSLRDNNLRVVADNVWPVSLGYISSVSNR